jgi:hypothetical protein
MSRVERTQVVTFAYVLGPVRPDTPQFLDLGEEELELPQEKRTMYQLGFDPDSGQVFSKPYGGDPTQGGEVPVIDLQTGKRSRLRQIAESYRSGETGRSPRKFSSVGLPEPATYDATDGEPMLQLLAKFAQAAVGGFQSAELHAEVMTNLAKQLYAMGYVPSNPGVVGENSSTQISEDLNDNIKW